jgi:hypothetical protein
MTLCVSIAILLGSFLCLVYNAEALRTSHSSIGGIPASELILEGILIIVFCLSILTAGTTYGPDSIQERENERKKEDLEQVTPSAEILARAITYNYPYILEECVAAQHTPCEYSLYESILHWYVIPSALHRINHNRHCADLRDCERDSKDVSKSIRFTLAILAKKFSDAAKAEKTSQQNIDNLVEMAKEGKMQFSHEEIEKLFAKQEVLDEEVEEAKKLFWKVHAAAKEIGEKVQTKVVHYLLLFRPEMH